MGTCRKTKKMQFAQCNPNPPDPPRMLQHCFSAEMFCGRRNFTWLSINRGRDKIMITLNFLLSLSFLAYPYPITRSLIYSLRSHLIDWLNGYIQHSWKSDKTGRWWVKAGIRKNMRMGAQSTLTSLHLNRSLTTQEVATPTPWSCLEGRKINEWIEEEKRKAELISCILISV